MRVGLGQIAGSPKAVVEAIKNFTAALEDAVSKLPKNYPLMLSAEVEAVFWKPLRVKKDKKYENITDAGKQDLENKNNERPSPVPSSNIVIAPR